ncbi:MAG: hypothetical protein AAF205_00290 [Pseudomonadota bacterium]
MGRRYPIARDQLISLHTWNFAIRRLQLPEDATPPAFGYSRQFTLPTDVLRVVSLRADGFNGIYARTPEDTYQVEGRKLLSDADTPLSILALVRVADTTLYPPLFQRALELYLASDTAESLTDSTTKAQRIDQAFRRVLAEAKAADAREGTPPRLDNSTWLDAHDRDGDIYGRQFFGSS